MAGRGGQITFSCANGARANGHLAAAEGAPAGVVVLQEWWGVNDQICNVADRLAAAGYMALVPDLYHGQLTSDAEEADHLMASLDWIGATHTEVSGAVEHLKSTVHKVAVLGFCMGGALAIMAGARLPSCDAVVCFYGLPPVEHADPATMTVPFLGHFANQDPWYPPQSVDAFVRALPRGVAPQEVHRYDSAHAFFNETGRSYDEKAAQLAWSRTLAFLQANLT